MSFLYDGTNDTNQIAPPTEIFVKNEYKKYGKIPSLSVKRLEEILRVNAFGHG